MLFVQLANPDYKIPSHINFIIGGISGAVGQTATHPMDVIKLRMQISKISVREAIHATVKDVGLRGFYLGWTAAFLRQLTYSTARLGIYSTLYDWSEGYMGSLNYASMISIGMISGVMGAFAGTPTDLAFVRMIGDMKLPPEKRRNSKNVIVVLIDIAKREGIRALWRGAVPTMTRAAIVNGTQLGTYSKSKILLKDTGLFTEGVLLSFSAGLISGLAMAVASLPVDVAKTRTQNLVGPTKSKGIFPMVIHIARTEGVRSLWRGFIPYYCRAAPLSVITMNSVSQEDFQYCFEQWKCRWCKCVHSEEDHFERDTIDLEED